MIRSGILLLCLYLFDKAEGFLGFLSSTREVLCARSSSSSIAIVSRHHHVSPTTALSATATSTSSRKNRVKALLDWSTENKIQMNTNVVDLTTTPSAGLGFVAKQDIASGQLLLQVPDTVALTVEAPGSGPNYDGVQRACRSARGSFSLSDLPWFVQFSLYLHMIKKGDDNGENRAINRKPWLDSLPSSMDTTPIHWTESNRKEWLQYSAMCRSVAKQENQWKSYFDTVSSTFPSMTWDDFLWGCETARSRAFSGSTAGRFNPAIYAFTLLLVTAYVGLGVGTLEQAANGAGVVFSATVLKDFVLPKLFKKKLYVICPVIDMANHDSVRLGAQVSLEYFANSYGLATTKEISKGDSIEISYGSRSNDQLLQYYGFVETDNPSDVYIMPPLREWPLDAIEQATGRKVSAGRLEKLNRAGLLGGDTTAASSSKLEEGLEEVNNPWGGVVVNRVVGVDPAVIQALRALMSTDQEWDAAGEAVGNFASTMSPENERAALLAAKTALELELASKPTTLQEDIDSLKKVEKGMDKVTDSEETMAIRFRIEKKKLLKEAIESIRI